MLQLVSERHSRDRASVYHVRIRRAEARDLGPEIASGRKRVTFF
jgi:hypothetical protein